MNHGGDIDSASLNAASTSRCTRTFTQGAMCAPCGATGARGATLTGTPRCMDRQVGPTQYSDMVAYGVMVEPWVCLLIDGAILVEVGFCARTTSPPTHVEGQLPSRCALFFQFNSITTVAFLLCFVSLTLPLIHPMTSIVAAGISLAIVGYREYTDYKEFEVKVDQCLQEWSGTPVAEIVSGGCRGADTMAERYAREHKISMCVLRPDWSKYPRGYQAYTMRDQDIARQCSHMIAFPSTQGKGTQHTIAFAEKLGKPTRVFWVQ